MKTSWRAPTTATVVSNPRGKTFSGRVNGPVIFFSGNMGRKKPATISFPLGGLDRRSSHRQQKPYTTRDCLNVRPVGTIQSRERGGSRPGLVDSHSDNLGSAVRFLRPLVLAPGTGFTSWSDTFGGLSLAAAWTQASWATDVPSILTSMASVDTTVSDAAAVRDALAIDSSEAYTVEMLLVPYSGGFHGKYQIFLRMDDTTPAYATEGLFLDLTMTGIGGVYSGTLTSYIGSAPTVYNLTGGTLTGSTSRAVWLIVQVVGDAITVFLDGTSILSQSVSAQSGLRVGFGLETTEAGGVNLVNVFRVQYTATGNVTPLRSVLTASAGGDLYTETSYGRLTKTTSDLSFRSDTELGSAQSGQNLYVADYGDLRITQTDGVISGSTFTATVNPAWDTLGILTDDDVCVLSSVGGSTTAGTYKISSVAAGSITLASAPGNGTASFRIERAPKVYTPSTDTIAIMTADTGQVPTGCPLVARYLDRLVLAGAEIAPGVWYMARVSDELDWDYSQTDSRRAVAGTASAAGVPARAITALAPHSDDYLILGCRESLWRLRGDPAYGGSLDALSHNVGIVGANAWTYGPSGELIFLSLDGIYVLPAGGDAKPVSLSREVLPEELLNFNPDTTTVNVEYDIQDRGVHVFLTPDSSNTRIHWWMDWERKTFWPLTYASDHEPTASCILQATAIEDSGVILGCRDGTLRRPSALAEDDSGTSFETYIKIGPLPLSQDGSFGVLQEMQAVIAEDSGSVTWEVFAGNTFEAASVSTTAVSSGTWEEGLSSSERPGGRGQAVVIELTGTTGRRWALEQIYMVTRDSGRRRID